MINGLVECNKMPKEHKFGTTRKYRRVLFLSIVTFGIYYIIYQYWLFQDFEEHHEKAFDTEPRAYPLITNPTTMLIFLFIFPFYPIYIKYTLLYDHIRTSSINSPENCSMGIKAVLTFVFLGLCTFGIAPLVTESRWQSAFNEHIIAHDYQKENLSERE